jgi:hypothetical protein
MKIRKFSTFFFVLAVALLTVNAVAQPGPTFKFADVKAKGATETDSYAVNDKGTIAGDYIDSAGTQHGMILAGKTLTSFDGPSGSTAIAAYGINTSNVVVGYYLDSNGVPTSFAYSNGTFTPIAYPKAAATEATGINDNGWIVGSYFDAKGVEHGFYFDTKKYHAVNVKGATTTVGWAINNKNTMTMYTVDSSGLPVDGFLLNGKKFTNVDVPSYTENALHAISNNGDLDYTVFDSSSNRHGVLYQASTGTFTVFDDPKGVNSTRADGINVSLTMVGRYSPASGTPPNAGFKVTTKP